MSKKIYFVVHSFSAQCTGGVNRVVSETANELAKDSNYDVNIVSLGSLDGLAYPLKDAVTLHTMKIERHSTSQYKGLTKILWLIFAYINLIKFYKQQDRKSVWNVTSPPLIILFFFLKKYENFFLYCEHTSPLGKKNNYFKNLIRALLLNKGDKTISLNRKDDEYYKSINVDSQLIYNGCKKIYINSKYKTKDIIFVGRFSKEKDPLEALDIFYKSNIWKKGYKLKFFGNGDLANDINLYCKEKNINQYIEVISSEKDPAKIYGGASALIMTSHYEGLPMVLIEAISSGVPCISYDCPQGPSEIIIDGVNGYLIKNREKSDFIERLSSLMHEELSSKNILDSSKKFDISNVVYEWEKFF